MRWVNRYLISIILSVLSCPAATYYVDFASGSNSNSGISPGSAWKHCPGDNNASGIPGSTVLQAGDIVRFRGTYIGSINLKWSGADGNPITYDGKDWGERTTITTAFQSSGGFSGAGTPTNNVVIRGFLFTQIGGYSASDSIWSTTTPVTAPPGGVGITLTSGGRNIIIGDCHFSEIGQWRNVVPMSGTTSVTGTGVSLENNTNVLVTDCDFTRMKTGVSIKSTSVISDITVRNSSFHNYMNWLVDVAPRAVGATIRNIVIEGCTFFDYKEFDLPNWNGLGEKPHQDGIFLRTSGMLSTWENIVIRNSKFYSDQASAGGTASIYLSQGASADIYNCLFLNDGHTNAYINVGFNKLAGMRQTVRIWNNTFVGWSRAIKVTPGNSNPDRVEILNNAFYRTGTFDVVSINPAEIGVLLMNNNVYFTDNNARVIHDGAAYRSFSQWVTLSGKDIDSTWGNPQFVNIAGAPSSWNVRPASGTSPLVKKGVPLLQEFSDAIDGAFRGNSWDVGAFNYFDNDVGPVPVAPSGLKLE